MTSNNLMTTFDAYFNEFFGNFDKINSLTTKAWNFPPYNLVKIRENEYTLQMAVAGFLKSEIKITVEDNILTIKGSRVLDDTESDVEYLYKGISNRDFVKRIKLMDNIKITDAIMTDGILYVNMTNNIPQKDIVEIEIE